MNDSDNTAAPAIRPPAPLVNWDGVSDSHLERGDHVELASLLIQRLHARYSRVVSSAGGLYAYDGAIYKPIDDELERIVTTFAGMPIGEGDKPRALSIRTGDISGTIKCTHIELSTPAFFDAASAGIAFRDGFVIVAGGKLELVPHSPEHRARRAYEFDFVGSRQPQTFFAFLGEVFRDDADRDEKIAALQEFFGAAITGCATVYERAALLLGNGSDGKSRLAYILEKSMPPGSTIALEPALFSDIYSRPLLEAALLNSVPDISQAKLGAAIKGIISGEGVAARDPGGRIQTFKGRAAHLFGCNKLPETSDTTDGFFRRWLVLKMTRSFLHDPMRDVNIHFRIIEHDRAAIVRWALEGAARLQAKNEYTLPTSHTLAIAEWRGRDDAARVFVDTCCTSGGGWTSATDLYEAFTVWGKPYGKTMTSTKFGLELKAIGVEGKRSGSSKLYDLQLRTSAAPMTLAA